MSQQTSRDFVALIHKSRTLHTDLTAVIAQSRALRACSLELVLCGHPRIRGASDVDSRDLTAAIRAKIAERRLPVARPSQIWAGDGHGDPCDACDLPIAPAEVEYEANFVGPEGAFRFHRTCFDAWHQERAERMPPPIAGGSNGADDMSLITDILAGGAALCVECIAHKTGLAPGQTGSLLMRIGQVLKVESAPAVCDGCLTTKRTFRLG